MANHESTKVEWKRLNLVACGYLRKYFATKNINPKDIAQIIVGLLFVGWEFNYFYDWEDRGRSKTLHGIYNNGKTVKCNFIHSYIGCCCFYRISYGMTPNSGTVDI